KPLSWAPRNWAGERQGSRVFSFGRHAGLVPTLSADRLVAHHLRSANCVGEHEAAMGVSSRPLSRTQHMKLGVSALDFAKAFDRTAFPQVQRSERGGLS